MAAMHTIQLQASQASTVVHVLIISGESICRCSAIHVLSSLVLCRTLIALCPVITIHYNDVILSVMAFQITGLAIVYSTVYSDADQRKHHSPALLTVCAGIHR